MEPCQRIDHRLDVAIQAQILDLLMSLKDEYGLSVLFITHDFGVVAQIADKVAVMYAGRLLEAGDVYDVFDHPAHPYTAGLLKTRPVIGRAIGEPLLEHRLATKADVNDRVAQILEIRAGARARVTATRFCVAAFHGGYMARRTSAPFSGEEPAEQGERHRAQGDDPRESSCSCADWMRPARHRPWSTRTRCRPSLRWSPTTVLR